MSIDELINRVMKQLEVFYEGRVVDYLKQRRHLIKSICRYGKECERRGWHVQPAYIYKDLLGILVRIQQSKLDINYMPALLESSVDKHVRFRAENIQEEAKKRAEIPEVVKRSVDGLETVTIQPTTVESLAKLYKAITSTTKKVKSDHKQVDMFK